MLFTAGVLTVMQYIVGFFIVYTQEGWLILRYLGWITWAISFVLGILPIFTLRRIGDDYRCYVQRVPRMNFMLGILQWLQRDKTYR